MLGFRHFALISLIVTTLLVSSASSAGRKRPVQRAPLIQQTESHQAEKYKSGQLLVRFRPGVGGASMQVGHEALGASVLKYFHVVENLQLIRLPAGVSMKQAARYYRANPDVLYAEPNYIRDAVETPVTPNDARYPEMWNLHNTGQSGGTPGADIHAPEAWGLATGSSTVVVAVIDTGIDYRHEDLATNVWSATSSYTVDVGGTTVTCSSGTHGFNAITMKCDPKDDAGHGTHVSGTIGAVGNNGVGTVGVNWSTQVIACKFLDAGGGGTTADAIACLEYIAQMKDSGVNIVATNNSYGGGGFSQAEKDAIDSHRQRGILFVAAAGNSAIDTDLQSFYPAKYDLPNIVGVAATDANDALAEFSNFGRHSVHLGAPGVDVLSTVPGYLFGEPYLFASGTSMAAPHVTAVAALLKVQDPSRDWKAIKNLMLAGGDSLNSLSNTISQKRLNAYGAMTCSNSVVQSRLLPQDTDAYVWAGDPLTLRVLNINCGAPNGAIEVLIDGGPETITLLDDGQGADLEANDGIYAAQRQWLASEVGDHTLTFPNHDVLAVHVIPPLSAYSYSTDIPFNYRHITGTDLHLRDDDSVTIHPPFPVRFGGASFPSVSVNSNGNISFFGPFVDWVNSPLPAMTAATVVAPFWDDLYATSGVRWDVTGTAPNRELVVEWRDAFAMACIWSESPRDYATFQAVFFESSTDILFNYKDVILGIYDPYDPWRGCNEEVNGGAGATVGVQPMRNLANQFSFATATLADNSSILWKIGSMTPAITQMSPFSVLAGSPAISLRVLGRSFLPGAVVRWNGADRTTTFVNAGELNTNISAGDLASAATVQVTVLNPQPNGGLESVPLPFYIYSSYPFPTLSNIIPNPAPLPIPVENSRASILVTLAGTNFVAGSVAKWNGTNLPTTLFGSTELQARVGSDIMSIGTNQVTVSNPTPGGGISNALTVSVVNPTPVLGWLTHFIGAGAPAFTLAVGGANFTPSSVVRWNGSDRPTTYVGGLYVTAEIPARDVATVGTAQVTVFTPPPGGGSSNAWTISILQPPTNDKFVNATVIPTYPFTLTENTPGATADPLDPNPNTPLCQGTPPFSQESVWFSFTPPSGGGILSVDTLGSDYTHEITAWSGSPGSFAPLSCTFNSYGTYMQAPLSFPVTPSAPVAFMVSTPQIGSAGKLVFNLKLGPGFKLDASPASNTVARGSSATYTVKLTPQFGSFNDPVTLSCYVVPAGPTCSFDQWRVVPGGSPVSVTLTVSTAQMSQLEMQSGPLPIFALWLSLPLFGLLASGKIVRCSRKTATAGALLTLVLAMIFLAMLNACGGGGGGHNNGNNQLPPKSYTITLVGTSGSISQQTTVSLSVN